MSATRTMYLHTLDGRPASADGANGILIFLSGQSRGTLAKSLKQVREEQARTVNHWRKHGLDITKVHTMGYVLVRVPNAD